MQLPSFRKPYAMLPPVPEVHLCLALPQVERELLVLEFRTTSPKLHTTTL